MEMGMWSLEVWRPGQVEILECGPPAVAGLRGVREHSRGESNADREEIPGTCDHEDPGSPWQWWEQ